MALAFLAGAFLADTFLALAFLAGAFLAATFLALAFFADAFLAVTFLVLAFFADAFFFLVAFVFLGFGAFKASETITAFSSDTSSHKPNVIGFFGANSPYSPLRTLAIVGLVVPNNFAICESVILLFGNCCKIHKIAAGFSLRCVGVSNFLALALRSFTLFSKTFGTKSACESASQRRISSQVS